MDKTVLQSLLDVQVFTLPDNDDRLTQLETSVTRLAERLQKNVCDISHYTLVALDPKITETEPVITEVEDIIKENWTTLRSNRPESPISIIRSVMLSALNTIGMEDADCAQIIYLTASNFYPYAVLGNEKEVIEKILLDIGKIAEQNANDEWSLTDEIPALKLPVLKTNPIKINNVSVEKETIETALTLPTVNPKSGYTAYGADSDSVNRALGELKTKAPSAIVDAVNKALTSLTSGIDSKDFETSITKFFTDFKKSLDTELKSSFMAIRAVERRSRLLWWKEALYSQHLKKSYREIDKELRPIVMAYDLFVQLPNITPVNVDYLLKDTLFQLNDKFNDVVKFDDILSAIEENSNKSQLQDCFNGNKIESEEQRISITDFIYLLVSENVESEDLFKRTGIDPRKTVTPCDLSVMVLHDLLSNRIAES